MFTQENRDFAIQTPLGQDVLLLSWFRGEEGLSTLFNFELELLSETHDIAFETIIGQNVTLYVVLPNGSQRYFHGMISRFGMGSEVLTGSERRLSSYSATMVPWLWLLTRTADSRIFQKLTVPKIVEKIFSDYKFTNFSFRLQGSYEPREYAVQYRETDFNFISRLLEEEGINYFFEHEEKKHTLVLADYPAEHKPCPNQEQARYHVSGGTHLEEDVITSLEVGKEIRAGKYTLNDFNFKTPKLNLYVSADSKQMLGPGEREIYDYPGDFGKREVGDQFVNVRMEEEEARMRAELKKKVQDFIRSEMNDKEFVLTRIFHEANQSDSFTSGSSGGNGAGGYSNSFQCIPYEIPFRPLRTTAKPVVEGIQTAIVVGPAGEEIYTDEHGRVKVQFHWDREGKSDENSACWMRVSQAMAGNRWGAMFLPRVGHEVIVDFVEGDPDRPIITGQVYHGINMPPYTLPDHKTISTFKSNSSPKGKGFNEVRFEDKKDEEQLFIHAEKRLDIRVKGNRLETIGYDRNLVVENDKKEHIKNDRNELVDVNHIEEIGGDRNLTVTGEQASSVGGNLSVKVGGDVAEEFGGNHSDKVGGSFYVTAGGDLVLEAGTNITLKVGGSYIAIDASGITINASGIIDIKGSMIKLN